MKQAGLLAFFLLIAAATSASVAGYTLTVVKAGSATGAVGSAPPGITCGPTCGAFADGTRRDADRDPRRGVDVHRMAGRLLGHRLMHYWW